MIKFIDPFVAWWALQKQASDRIIRITNTPATEEEMHDQTKQALDWFLVDGIRFRHAGTPNPRYSCVDSWATAAHSSSTLEWENFNLDHKNQLTTALYTIDKQLLKTHNAIVADIRPQLEGLQGERVFPLVGDSHERQNLIDTLRWDIMAICISIEFQAIYQSPFYPALYAVYHAGHFPCGWYGIYPSGQFMVY